jgi:putative flippase GtrA
MLDLSTGSVGRKRRFLLFGSLNVVVTNACLQALLRIVPIGVATLFSQLINLVLGFVLYGKYVFRVNRLRRRSAVLYAIVSALIWVINWGGILLLVHHGIQRNLAALVMMPLLPWISYGLQRHFVFP